MELQAHHDAAGSHPRRAGAQTPAGHGVRVASADGWTEHPPTCRASGNILGKQAHTGNHVRVLRWLRGWVCRRASPAHVPWQHGCASRWKKPYLMRDRGVNLEDVIPVHTTRDCLRPRCELCDDPSAPPRSRTHATLVRSPVVALLNASGCVRNCGRWGGRCATTARPPCATTAGIARTATARDRSCTPSTTSTIASCAACLQLRGRA